ncbi:hydroxymethylglutaryl-CoA lyase [Polycladomyces abyssicola]|uniref:hydroxymethylglutaryl-CoA lyase n=1 Tax=Polycladomyces abyssicola TaxID=1125966 RepID=UPI001BB2E413
MRGDDVTRVTIVEVGLRDGLQNESVILPVEVKRRIAEGLIRAGVKEIEATSFVHPRWVPQLADAAELAAQLPREQGVRYRALVPNAKGLERALSTPIDEYAVFLSASETHNRKNINKSIDETYPVLAEVVERAQAAGKRVRGYVSTVFGCPYEGDVPVSQVVRMCERLIEMGVYEISLGDTIGVATPKKVKETLEVLLRHIPAERLAGHFHDTRGTALVNAYVSLEMGIRTLDGAFGGLGGCPYAPGASGNVATEDLVYFLEQEGIETGIDLETLCRVSVEVQKEIGRPLSSKVLQSVIATWSSVGKGES